LQENTVDGYLKELEEAVRWLRDRIGEPPEYALVLGSGLGAFVEEVRNSRTIPYQEIPYFPVSGVLGHKGQLTLVDSETARFCALQGRVHSYEGRSLGRVVFAVRVLATWGIESFIVTNAAGGINRGFSVGDLMLIDDHINLIGGNPLTGPNLGVLGPRFPDMTFAYDPGFRKKAKECSKKLRLSLREGVYAAVQGPSYETPAEIEMLRRLGADAVGMSTVPEVIALNHMGKRVLGISCITNMAAGVSGERMAHDDVIDTTTRVKDDFGRLILSVLEAGGANE